MNGASIRFLAFFIALLALTASLAAQAQERGAISVFGGYSQLSEILGPEHYGWNASVSGNLLKHLALVADISRHQSKETTGWFGGPATRCISVLFGARFVHTIGRRWSPFVHGLFGLYHKNEQFSSSQSAYGEHDSRNYFAMDFGIGMDINVNKRFSIRAIQLDGMRSGGGHEGYLRGSFGAVFHLRGISK